MPVGPQFLGPGFRFGPDIPDPRRDFGPGEPSLESIYRKRDEALLIRQRDLEQQMSERQDYEQPGKFPQGPHSSASECCRRSARFWAEKSSQMGSSIAAWREYGNNKVASLLKEVADTALEASRAAAAGQIQTEWLAVAKWLLACYKARTAAGQYGDETEEYRSMAAECKEYAYTSEAQEHHPSP
jgi:hypothetical protein